MSARLKHIRKLRGPMVVAAALALGWPALGAFPGTSPLLGVATALAGDDDDDDDGGGGRRGGISQGHNGDGVTGPRRRSIGTPSPRTFFRDLRRAITGSPAPRRQARPAAPPPSRAENEIVALGIDDAGRAQLVAAGYTMIEEAEVASLGTSVLKLRIPAGTTLDAAREEVRAIAAGSQIDFNHYYRTQQQGGACSGPHCAAAQMIGWPGTTLAGNSCPARIRIGLIDTGINPDHAAFDGGRLETIRLGGEALSDSGLQHGTAIAALLVGATDSRTPGLLPDAEVVAIDAFHRAGRQDDRADVFTLVRAIDLALEREVAVLNMSLAGPQNDLLRSAIARAGEQAVVVAAVGNVGPRAEPAFPAAYDGVIGVTAVDRAKRVYRRAGRGDHVDFAAPGVEVWTAASIRGGRPKTGTSFATPFVTAAVALLRASDPDMPLADIKQRLAGDAEDLGEPGRDPVFGWGLLNATGLCTGDGATMTPASADGDEER